MSMSILSPSVPTPTLIYTESLMITLGLSQSGQEGPLSIINLPTIPHCIQPDSCTRLHMRLSTRPVFHTTVYNYCTHIKVISFSMGSASKTASGNGGLVGVRSTSGHS